MLQWFKKRKFRALIKKGSSIPSKLGKADRTLYKNLIIPTVKVCLEENDFESVRQILNLCDEKGYTQYKDPLFSALTDYYIPPLAPEPPKRNRFIQFFMDSYAWLNGSTGRHKTRLGMYNSHATSIAVILGDLPRDTLGEKQDAAQITSSKKRKRKIVRPYSYVLIEYIQYYRNNEPKKKELAMIAWARFDEYMKKPTLGIRGTEEEEVPGRDIITNMVGFWFSNFDKYQTEYCLLNPYPLPSSNLASTPLALATPPNTSIETTIAAVSPYNISKPIIIGIVSKRENISRPLNSV